MGNIKVTILKGEQIEEWKENESGVHSRKLNGKSVDGITRGEKLTN